MARIRQQLNPGLVLTGIVVGRVSRTNHARDVMAGLRATLRRDVFEPTIRDSIRVPEAATAGLPVTAYAPDATVAADIRLSPRSSWGATPTAGLPIAAEADEQAGWRGLVGRLVGLAILKAGAGAAGTAARYSMTTPVRSSVGSG